MRKLIIILIAVALVIPTAHVLYALVGGGWLGSILCLLLGIVAHMSVSFLVGLVVEAYEWFKYRKAQVEDPPPLTVPESIVYDIDWTKYEKDGKL